MICTLGLGELLLLHSFSQSFSQSRWGYRLIGELGYRGNERASRVEISTITIDPALESYSSYYPERENSFQAK